MFSPRLSFSTLVLLFFCFTTTSNANISQNCNITSSCGNIQNISYPFRLKTDPQNCGDPSYELACENNQTLLYFNFMGYHVLSIDYEKYTIRIVDPGIKKNQCPSFPLYSLNLDDIPTAYTDQGIISVLITAVTFISCPREVKSSLYIDTASCNTNNSSTNASSSALQEYLYVLVGSNVSLADIEDSCTINKVSWISNATVIDKTSFLRIRDRMANGFSLYWHRVYCNLEFPARPIECYFDNLYQTEDNFFYRPYLFLHHIWRVLPAFLEGDFSKEQFKNTPVKPDPGWVQYRSVIISILKKLTVLVLLVRFLCGFTTLLIIIFYKNRKRHLSSDETIEDFLQGQINLMPIRYKYTEIKKMTNKFKNKLGEGGYGSVYKGKLRSGLFVAVKMMNKSKASGQEFINEVATIGTIHHANVVQLIGFCVQGSTRALVYEFMPNGSLEKYIFSEENSMSLSYEKMYDISLGVARGLDYLHQGCEMQILHFDIKPHNILLNDNFNPKISDFGLAKLYSADDSIVSLTAARGTIGYIAPELFYKNIGGVSYKADVYSYGMLLMEMAGRRKNLNKFAENLSQIDFPSWVYDQFNERDKIEVEDRSNAERELVKKMILVALWCIQMKPVDRPSMSKIVEMLEGDENHLQMPPKPFLYPQQSPANDQEIQSGDDELPLLSENINFN